MCGALSLVVAAEEEALGKDGAEGDDGGVSASAHITHADSNVVGDGDACTCSYWLAIMLFCV